MTVTFSDTHGELIEQLDARVREVVRREGVDSLLARIAKDENLHMVFYHNIVAAALDIDATMRAIADEVIGFEMPGATMAGWGKPTAGRRLVAACPHCRQRATLR